MNQNIIEISKFEIYRTKLNFDLNPLKKISFELQNDSDGRIKTNVGGWQSEDLFDEYPIIKQLRQIILENLNNFSKQFNFNKALKLTNLWININGYKDSNETHTHPSSFFSGVFYVKTPENSGNLSFVHPSCEFCSWVFEKNITNYITNNSAYWSFQPKENELYIFPSFYKHKVTPNMNKDEKRISISFNSYLLI